MWKESGMMKMKMKMRGISLFFFIVWLLQFTVNGSGEGVSAYERVSSFGTVGCLLKKEERKPLLSTEFGAVSAVDIGDGTGRRSSYHLQFITLEPNSLFLPVLLHADMVFYVHTGLNSGLQGVVG